jgi:hypothetical protein
MSTVSFVRVALLVLAGLGGCHCAPSFGECAPIEPPLLAAAPRSLADTGLRDPASGELAAGVRAYTPRFELWSDGADKRRWVLLPPGAQIDTTDMDAWRFPVGTRFWKEFTRDGVVVETRFLLKHGAAADAWTPMAYLHGSGGEAQAAPAGVVDARGTEHDVPDAASCRGCHGGVESGVLGFSAVQLPWEGSAGELGLGALVAQGALTRAPSGAAAVPGDETTVAALGYLHANCSHCHNQARPPRPGPRCFDPESTLDFTLRVRDLQRLESTAVYRTAVGSFIQPGEPADSEVIIRARSRDRWWGMPALGTERVDAAGVAVIERWIERLR